MYCRDEWPKITKLNDERIKIEYLSDRPYMSEIIDFMESKGYVLVGAHHGDWMITAVLLFKMGDKS